MNSASVALWAVLMSFAAGSLSAQQHAWVPAPHKPVPPKVSEGKRPHPPTPTKRSMIGGPWMTDPNYRSVLYVRNNVQTAPMSVTPILYLGNGAQYRLSPVQLSAGGTAVLNINDALQRQGIAGWAALSGYIEL